MLEMHFEQHRAPSCVLALHSLCLQLNGFRPRLPETDYELRFHVKHHSIGEQTAKTKNARLCQVLWPRGRGIGGCARFEGADSSANHSEPLMSRSPDAFLRPMLVSQL